MATWEMISDGRKFFSMVGSGFRWSRNISNCRISYIDGRTHKKKRAAGAGATGAGGTGAGAAGAAGAASQEYTASRLKVN